jgi:hypothetical protein
MPLNKKGKKIMKSMKEQYGSKKGKTVFYASMNKGVIKGVEKKKQGGAMSKKPYEKFKDTTKQEYESKKKRFPMMPKDEFDIRFENNPDFFESGVSRAYTGGMMKKKNQRLKELEEELGINTKPTRPAPETGSPYPTPPKKGPASQGMKEGGDIDARVEEELKKETPNAYPIMKGFSPITHLRRYLKKRELLSKKEKGIGLYDSPKTESKSGFGKVFKEARKKGEGTKFKYKEKDYSAVTKEDVSKSGKSSLKDYLDSPSKMKSGGSVMVKTKLGRNKPTRLC